MRCRNGHAFTEWPSCVGLLLGTSSCSTDHEVEALAAGSEQAREAKLVIYEGCLFYSSSSDMSSTARNNRTAVAAPKAVAFFSAVVVLVINGWDGHNALTKAKEHPAVRAHNNGMRTLGT